jgi:DNA modification methylase
LAENVHDKLKDLDNLKPIDHAVVAKPHTPIYKMHRYFARRPWSVFRSLIEHYSNPGSIILDPFCGGGVTVVEGLRLGRKVIGVDINPLATFITRMEVIDVDLDEIRVAFKQIEESCRGEIEQLYTVQPDNGDTMIADWYEWSSCYECPHCRKRLVCSQAKKNGPGDYKCPSCGDRVITTDTDRVDEEIVRLAVRSRGGSKRKVIAASKTDQKLAHRINTDFGKMMASKGLSAPADVMPDSFELRRPYNQHCKQFTDFFTHRNLYAISLLFAATKKIEKESIRHLLLLNLTSLMLEASILAQIKSNTVVKPAAHYWISDLHAEGNIWRMFASRFNHALLLGKKYWKDNLHGSINFAKTWSELVGDGGDCLLINASSTKLTFPDESIDAIITDPPYGGNVMYTEMSNFWFVWLREELGFKSGLIDAAEEAVQSKSQNKGPLEYRDLLYRVFKECHRVLKPHRWMVMTFHNREFKVWNSIHLAAHDAGFVLSEYDGMIYQPPIEAYTTTLYQSRSGSMLGDFVLSFQKVDKLPKFKAIEHADIGRYIEQMAGEVIIYHNGATLSTIYMKLIPWLLNNNLMEKIGENEVAPYLSRNFVECDGKWHIKDEPDQSLKEDLERYSQQHYKTSYNDAMQTVPVEARLEYLIRRLLYRKGRASQDEVINEVYTNLINSNAADYVEIQRVLGRIAEMRDSTEGMAGSARKGIKKRKIWQLKEDVLREQLFSKLGEDIEKELKTTPTEESDHDLAIARLVEIAGSRNFKAHIGRTEQIKYAEFRQMSSDLPQQVKGMPKGAREIIEQIDVLWHNGGKGILAAFEVERTTTITSGIDRFRNLLTAAPESEIELYLVVPKSRGNEVRSKLGSPANRKDGLHKKIGYIYLEDLDIRHADAKVDLEKIRHFINGGGK